jgi:hypothetical protein
MIPYILLFVFSAVQAPPAPASVEGVVVTIGSGEPVAGVRVMLDPASGRNGQEVPCPAAPLRENVDRCVPASATSGADGKFSFTAVNPGAYRLFATRSGNYLPAEYGQRTVTGEGIPLDLASGQRAAGIVLRMSPTGAIEGRVFDRDGEPLGKAQVQALRPIYRNGVRTLTIVQAAETNDRGEYRLFWLAPGLYYVSAKPDVPSPGAANPGLPASLLPNPVRTTNPARFGSYEQASSPVIRKRVLKTGEIIEETGALVYFPGVIGMASAVAVNVAAGATTGGVDIATAPGFLQTHHIRGRVIDGATGQAPARASIEAMPRSIEPLRSVPIAQVSPDGTFDVAGALPGSYIVVAQSQGRNLGMVSVDVGARDVDGVTIVTTAGFKLAGRFMLEGPAAAGSAPNMADLRVSVVRDPDLPGLPSPGPSFNPPPAPDGSFALEGVMPGDFRVAIRGMSDGAYVKSMRMGHTDVLDGGLHLNSAPQNPLEITIALDAGSIQGAVVDSRQLPLANRTVVLVPEQRLRHRQDLYRSMATGSAGQFQMKGVAPGNYKLFAWDNVEGGAWFDPEFIRSHEDRGIVVDVRAANNANVQVTVIP